MSDYLHNLAARTLGIATTIRPRVASFYEPPQQFDVAMPVEDGTSPPRALATAPVPQDAVERNEFTVNETHPVIERSSTIATSTIEHGVLSREGHHTERVVVAEAHGETEPHRTAARPSVPVVPAPDRREAPREEGAVGPEQPAAAIAPPQAIIQSRVIQTPAPPQQQIAIERHVPAEAPSLRTVVESHHTTERLVPEPSATPVVSLPPRPIVIPEVPAPQTILVENRVASPDAKPPAIHINVPPRESRVSVESHIASNAPPSPSPSQRIVIEPRITPHIPPVPQRIREERAPESAPDIHVTIGCVEVRAVTAAEPPARARIAQAPGLMSLDDYLRRRGERTKR